MPKAPLAPEQWVEARRLRAEGLSFAAIAKQVGAGVSTIRHRAAREEWPAPRRTAQQATHRPPPAPLPADTAEVRSALVHRLYAVMDLSLQMTELRVQHQLKTARKQATLKNGELPSNVREEDMRQIINTIGNLEQAKELHPDLDRSADGGARPAGTPAGASEADAFRREIAERLEKLVPPA
jgi:hypothetical protein